MDSVKLQTNVLSKDDFLRLKFYFQHHETLGQIGLDEHGRKLLGDATDPILKEFAELLLPLAKDIFQSATLASSYSLFAEYSGETISLYKHKDSNACTYTIDLVLYQDKQWGLWIDGVEYLANENEAICFLGEDSIHWRETITDNKAKIAVIFFHYVEPDHWWFKKAKDEGNANA